MTINKNLTTFQFSDVDLSSRLKSEIVDVKDNSDEMFQRTVISFANGYQASLIRSQPADKIAEMLGFELPYSFEIKPEGAVMVNGSLDYSTPITDDVVRFYSVEDLENFVISVSALRAF